MDFLYFGLIYNWFSNKVTEFGSDVMSRSMFWVSAVAVALVTIWILIQGYRMVTGQSREPMMAMVGNMAKIAVIVTAASTMAIGSVDLQRFFTTDLQKSINELVTGEDESPVRAIDRNLVYTQLAMGAIDGVQVGGNDIDTVALKGRASLMAMLGVAGPPMTAGAMLLMYQLAMALFIGLGPIFILCLIFEQTKNLFNRWLMYGLATLFSMAVLNFVVSMVLEMTLRVAAALWASNVVSMITGDNVEGFTNQAMQQGGVGLLMTALIISTPPMAAMFFGGTLGQFMSYAQVNGGKNAATPGPGGQPPGSHGAPASSGSINPSSVSGEGRDSMPPVRTASTPTPDVVRPHQPQG